MTSLSITFICQPYEVTTMGSGPERYMPFIDAVRRHSGSEIPVVHARLKDAAPKDGFILFAGAAAQDAIAECPTERQVELASRLVPIDESRTRILDRLLEPHSIPAAIDNVSRREWETAPERVGADGLYGRKDIGTLVGASCLIYESARYCYLQSPTHLGLPHLLADYLAKLAEAGIKTLG